MRDVCFLSWGVVLLGSVERVERGGIFRKWGISFLCSQNMTKESLRLGTRWTDCSQSVAVTEFHSLQCFSKMLRNIEEDIVIYLRIHVSPHLQ